MAWNLLHEFNLWYFCFCEFDTVLTKVLFFLIKNFTLILNAIKKDHIRLKYSKWSWPLKRKYLLNVIFLKEYFEKFAAFKQGKIDIFLFATIWGKISCNIWSGFTLYIYYILLYIYCIIYIIAYIYTHAYIHLHLYQLRGNRNFPTGKFFQIIKIKQQRNITTNVSWKHDLSDILYVGIVIHL